MILNNGGDARNRERETNMDTTNKPKTIQTIDINIQWPSIDKKTWLEETLSDHLQCVLCGSDLAFKHVTDFVTRTVCEDARCPSCNIRNRQTQHGLQ